MIEYPHIDTVYKRTKDGRLILGDWTRPEFEYLADRLWRWTEKVDGTNTQVLWDGNQVHFGGKTVVAQLADFLLDFLVETFPSEKLQAVFGPKAPHDEVRVCLYGEGYGARIQKVGTLYDPDRVHYILFDVLVASKVNDKPVNLWLERRNVEDVAAKLGIPVVPIVREGNLHEMIEFVKRGYDSTVAASKAVPAEGVVARPHVETYDRKGRRVISKLKTKDFRRAVARDQVSESETRLDSAE